MKLKVYVTLLTAFLWIFAVCDGTVASPGPGHEVPYKMAPYFTVNNQLARLYGHHRGEITFEAPYYLKLKGNHEYLTGEPESPWYDFMREDGEEHLFLKALQKPSLAVGEELLSPGKNFLSVLQLDNVPSEPSIGNAIKEYQFDRTGEYLRSLTIPLYTPATRPDKTARFIPDSVKVGMEVDVAKIADDVKSMGGGDIHFPSIIGNDRSSWLNPEGGYIRFEWTWGGRKK